MALVLDLQKIIVWYGNRQDPYKDTELVYSLLSCRYVEGL